MIALPALGGLARGAWSLFGKHLTGAVTALAIGGAVWGALALRDGRNVDRGREQVLTEVAEQALERAKDEKAAANAVESAQDDEIRDCLVGGRCVFRLGGMRFGWGEASLLPGGVSDGPEDRSGPGTEGNENSRGRPRDGLGQNPFGPDAG
ncbi:MAG: hypothetical protein ACFB0F_07385 [Neomegalonema sp.]